LVHPDFWLSERLRFHNIAATGAVLCARSGEKTRWLNPAPCTAAKGMYLVGARKQELPGAALPWEWPAVISPDEPDLSTPGTLGAQYEAEARALYDALDKIGR